MSDPVFESLVEKCLNNFERELERSEFFGEVVKKYQRGKLVAVHKHEVLLVKDLVNRFNL